MREADGVWRVVLDLFPRLLRSLDSPLASREARSERGRPAIATPAAYELAPQAAFILTFEVAILVRSWSVLISSCILSSRSFAASLRPSSLAQVLSVP